MKHGILLEPGTLREDASAYAPAVLFFPCMPCKTEGKNYINIGWTILYAQFPLCKLVCICLPNGETIKIYELSTVL